MTYRNMCPYLILICILSLGQVAFAEGQGPLTLTQALEISLKNNPGLKAARDHVEEALYSYRAAGSFPALTLAGNYTGGSNNIVPNNGQRQDFNLNLSQSFGPIGSVGLSGKAALRFYQASQFEFEEARITLIQNVKDAFYTLLAAQEQQKAAEENLALARELYNLAQKQFKAGAVPETDWINARIQEAAAEQTMIQALGALKQAQAAFNLLLAYPSSNFTTVSGKLDLVPLNRDLESLVGEALANRPAVKAAQKLVEQAQTGVDLAKSQHNPSPSIFLDQDVTTPSLYMVGVSIQFPVFDYGTIGNQVKVGESTVNEMKENLSETILNIRASVKSAYAAYQSAYQNASNYKESVLSPSEKLMKMTRFGYRQGALPYLQVLVAEQNLKSARTQYISLLLAGHQAMDALDAAVGNLHEGGEK